MCGFTLNFVSLLLLALSGICSLIEAKFYSADIARERLVTDLFVNYDASARPKEEHIDVTVNIVLQHFDFRETDGAFHFVGLLDASWRDPKLAWNPKDYNNLTKISVSPKIVWVPDLEIYNNAPDKFLRMHRNGIVVLNMEGDVLWSDVVDITMFCTTNMLNWPHDSHVCKMSLGSWTYDGFELDIVATHTNSSMNFDNIEMKNMQFRVVNYTAEHVATMYSCCAEPYISIDYHLTFERRSKFVVIFRAPAFCVIVLTLLALSLEPQRSEKLWLNGVSFVIIAFQLIYFASNIGRFSRGTPLIVRFYSVSLVLVTFTQLISVFSLMATRARYRGKLPWRVSSFLKSTFVQYIAPSTDYAQNRSSQHNQEFNSQFEDVKLQEFSQLLSVDYAPNEWVQLAKFVERSALAVFGFIYLVLSTSCFV